MKMKERNTQLKSALNTLVPVERVKSSMNVPEYDTVNREGCGAYKVDDKLRLIAMLNTLKIESQFYRNEESTMKELRELIEKIAVDDPYFVAQAICWSRNLGEKMRTINHLAAVLVSPFIAGKDYAKRFYGPFNKKNGTGGCVFRVDDSNFEDVERTPKDYNQDQLDLFLNNVKSDRNDLDLLFGCMLDWGVKLSLPMSSEEVDGKMIYTVNDGDLVACFADKVTDKVVKAMADKQPLRVIFRDSCFEQDADKINIYETFKQLLDWSDKDVEKNIRVI